MKTIAILAASLLTATAADFIAPSASQTVTNVTRSQIVFQVTTTQIVQRVKAPVFWNGTTQWLSSDKVLSAVSVTNEVKRGLLNRNQ